MQILGQPASPFEAMLIRLLTQQLPGERVDVKAAKAAALAKVILAEAAKQSFKIVNLADVVCIQQDYSWRDSELAAFGMEAPEKTVECLDDFASQVATLMRQHGLAQVQAFRKPGDNPGDEMVAVLRCRTDLIAPGYAKAMAERNLAAAADAPMGTA